MAAWTSGRALPARTTRLASADVLIRRRRRAASQSRRPRPPVAEQPGARLVRSPGRDARPPAAMPDTNAASAHPPRSTHLPPPTSRFAPLHSNTISPPHPTALTSQRPSPPITNPSPTLTQTPSTELHPPSPVRVDPTPSTHPIHRLSNFLSSSILDFTPSAPRGDLALVNVQLTLGPSAEA